MRRLAPALAATCALVVCAALLGSPSAAKPRPAGAAAAGQDRTAAGRALTATAAKRRSARRGERRRRATRRGRSRWKRERGLVFREELNNPDIVRLPDGRFRAYLMTRRGIVSAISSDGRRFRDEPGVRVAAGQHHAVVRLPDGRWRMYYSPTGFGVPGAPDPGGASASASFAAAVVSAVSSNGLDFEPEPGVRLPYGTSGEPDASGVIHPHVVELPGGGYRMYYDAQGGPDRGDGPDWRGIMSAVSDDGLTWRRERGFRVRPKRGRLRFAHLVWSAYAERSGRRWNLYFSAETDRSPRKRAGIYRATSSDGVRFKVPKRPELGLNPKVKKPRTGPGGLTGLPQDAFIVTVKGGKRLFYWQARQGTFSALKRGR